MIQLYDNDTDDLIGEITEDQLKLLVAELEETSESDRDYYIHGPALEMLEEAGADDDLLELLQAALGEREGVEVRWEGSAD